MSPLLLTIRWYLIAAILVASALLCRLMLDPFVGSGARYPLFITAVALVALSGRVGPTLAGSLMAILLTKVFFVPVRHSFLFESTGDRIGFTSYVACFFVLVAAAVLIRRQRRRLQESEYNYRELVEAGNSIIIRWDAEGCLTFINEFGLRFFGYEAEEIIGKPILDTIVPEKDEAGKDLKEMIDDILHHPERYHYNENQNRCKDGRRVWVAWTNRAINGQDGSFSGVHSIGLDITDRMEAQQALEESEERFRKAIFAAPFPIMIHREDGKIVVLNDAWQKGCGYPREKLQTVDDWISRAFVGEKTLRNTVLGRAALDGCRNWMTSVTGACSRELVLLCPALI